MKPYYEDSAVTIYLGDCRWIMPSLEKVDLVLTDPPYPSLRKWEGIGTTGRMGMGRKGTSADDPSKLFETIRNEDIPPLLCEFHRLLKEGRHALVMSDDDTLPFLLQAVGQWQVCKDGCQLWPDVKPNPRWSNWKLLIWDKERIGMGYHFRSQHEYLMLLDKGKNRPPNSLGRGDVFRYPPDEKLVPTQKPLALFKEMIHQLTQPGEIILDPFLGSGTALRAAMETGRRGIGIEKSERACEIAAKRMAQGMLGAL